MACLNPHLLRQSPAEARVKCNNLLIELKKLQILNMEDGSNALKEFDNFITNSVSLYKEDLENFLKPDGKSQFERLDDFLWASIGCKAYYSNLWKVCKIVMICFSSQGKVERGFSEN